MRVIDSTLLCELVPHYHKRRGIRQHQNIMAIGPYMPATLIRYDINTMLRQAHFLAQVCEESFALSDMKEEASGAEYEGRVKGLGNTQKGDGIRFKGRGLIQVTGRSNYKTLGDELCLDLIANPKLLEAPAVALASAGQYWYDKHLNIFADKDDLEGITRRINGRRMLGLQQRAMYLAKAKQLLGSCIPSCGTESLSSGVLA